MIGRIFKIGIVLLVAGAIGWIVWKKFFGGQGPAMQGGGFPTLVEIQKPAQKTIPDILTAVGTVYADEQVMLQPEIPGRIVEVPAQEGTEVEAGKVLFRLDDREQRAAVQEAQANLKLAQVNLNRTRILQEAGGVSTSELDRATASLKTAEAAVMTTTAQLDKTRIMAPFKGVVGLRQVSPGNMVAAGQTLASFAKLDPVKIDFTVPEINAGSLAPGQEVSVQTAAAGDRLFKGTISAIDPVLDPVNRTVTARAVVPNEEQLLKPGAFANVSVTLKEKPGALLIPEASIVPQGKQQFVFVKTFDDKAALKKITIGQRYGDQVEVVEGLTADDDVITTGQIKLREGAPVTTQMPGAPPAAAPAAAPAHNEEQAAPSMEEKQNEEAPAAPSAPAGEAEDKPEQPAGDTQ